MTQVTQGDIDASNPFIDRYLDGSSFAEDREELSKAFAAHRIQARKEALEEAAVYLISYNEDALAEELRNLANEVE